MIILNDLEIHDYLFIYLFLQIKQSMYYRQNNKGSLHQNS